MRPGKRLLISLVLGVLLVGPGWRNAHDVTGVAVQTSDPVFVGAGDITNCRRDGDDATAKLLDGIEGTVFTLGDNAYPDGTLDQYKNCYDPTWGRHKSRTMPAPGNHDYHTTGAEGYFSYFGAAASPSEAGCTSDCKGYYSYDLGAWHIIVINSEIDISAGSPQEQWLRTDLETHPAACTLAYWHEPRFNSGKHGNAKSTGPLWQALYEYHADVVLNGHDHNYQRFALQNPQGQADPEGIREFVVGTGGAGLYGFTTNQPNTEIRDNSTTGVLKLTLHDTSYDWEFIPVPGGTFTDSGTADCVGEGNTAPPAPPPATASAPTGTPVVSTTGTAISTTPTVPATPTVFLTPETPPAPVPEPSFFKRIIAWFISLFSGG